MIQRAKFDLEALREIGWSKWDPIGVGGSKNGPGADEYDTYLLGAAGQIVNGQSVDRVADYLVMIETEHMGLDAVAGIRERALEVASAIRRYVETARG